MQKFLLTTLNAKYIHLNLAIRILYDLNKDAADLHWKEYTIKEDQAYIAKECAEYNVVCFSCYIWNITPTLKVAEQIKLINPNTKILLGGPEVSYDWSEVIAQNCIDFIILGEGEIPFQQFVKQFPLITDVPNLVYKNEEQIIFNNQNVDFNLSNLENHNPYIYDDTNELQNKVCYIETSRGCPYKCEFCLASLDNKVRYLPMNTIKNNLLYLMQNGKTIKFLDRTFNVKKDFAIDIFQFILNNYRSENVFQFEITADIVHPDIIQFINENVPKGLFRFEIGIQTVNQKSNLEVSRKQNFEKTKSIILALNDVVEMHLDLIVGLPLEYWNDLKYSFEEVFKIFAPELQLGFLKFLKGTPVREKFEQYGYVFDPLPPYQIIKSNFLNESELEKITLLENALEIYWNKKRAINTLKYITKNYSIFDFLLQLGTAFKNKTDNKAYTLKQIYEIIYNTVCTEYSNDIYLKEIVAIDYYMQYKVKPQTLFIEEINKTEKNKIINSNKFNHHKYRYVAIPISFDVDLFLLKNIIKPFNNIVFIEYNGIDYPIVKLYELPILA